MNTIQWTVRASRQLRKVKEAPMRKRIYREVQSLADFPDCANVKKLTNAVYPYRLRVGDYRVFFEFDGMIQVVFIEEVRKRNERTY